ncbi:peptide ABC transporter permease [Rhodanobacter sp. FW510-R12]|uniref:ABC transporter permease n=1 Tax=unclassified Rhodanobacter TaxID=2621553 RepID=UPI0007A9BE36|nr:MULTISPECIES: FtsX-like permease family protein [unclassified Rhodanobacter]KZC16810.1 peptide ABC transporter permease [Rhodanobacter sp. FW104-R8]KZC27675.1 peptide ABC transporter permease [Rhodanobacter sp. FW510-T8]KZC33513.1 peptide ABC transporter permease [Rhodanobacter sp. FW510-R10]
MNIQIRPILTALRRYKAGTLLIALQIALTLAIVCNALFIIHQRLANLSAASGVDEANVFVIANMWADVGQSTAQVDAQVRADLLALRQLPAVSDATPASGYPLRGGGWDNFVTMTPEQTRPTTDAAVYTGDEHFIGTLGLKLVAGRNFRPDEVMVMGTQQAITPPTAIVSKALADRLFPDGNALGKSFYAMGATPSTIVGIVDPLHRQGVDQWSNSYAGQALIWPMRADDSRGIYYIVRARPGQLADAMREAPKALYAQSRLRIIDPKDGIQDYATIRHKVYDRDRGMAILMGIISVVLLAITAAGIVGLTSFWVGQRRKQIGVRRALGARQRDILAYFLTENFLISAVGVVLGTVLAIAFNLWTVTRFEMSHMSMAYVGIGVAVLLLLGQGAVLAPALRASRVSPVEATRSV